MDKRRIPKWLLEQEGVTQRQWKVRKRRELLNLEGRFEDFRLGCAYTPACNGEVGVIDGAIKSLREMLSVKVWGR